MLAVENTVVSEDNVVPENTVENTPESTPEFTKESTGFLSSVRSFFAKLVQDSLNITYKAIDLVKTSFEKFTNYVKENFKSNETTFSRENSFFKAVASFSPMAYVSSASAKVSELFVGKKEDSFSAHEFEEEGDAQSIEAPEASEEDSNAVLDAALDAAQEEETLGTGNKKGVFFIQTPPTPVARPETPVAPVVESQSPRSPKSSLNMSLSSV